MTTRQKTTAVTTAAAAVGVAVWLTMPDAPAPTRVRLSWYHPGAASGWVIEESTNLVNWFQVVRITNTIGSNARVTNDFTTTNNPAYWRVGSFNQ